MKKALTILGVAAVCLVGTAAWAGDLEGSDYTSSEGRFSVRMPVTPLTLTKSMPTPLGDIDIHMFMAVREDKGDNFMVAYADMPRGLVEQGSAEEILKGAANSAVGGLKGKILDSKTIQLGQYTGLEFDAEVLNGAATIRGRLYLVNNRLYQVYVISTRAKDATEVDQFLDSFKVTEN
jgi:hypothetical protein